MHSALIRSNREQIIGRKSDRVDLGRICSSSHFLEFSAGYCTEDPNERALLACCAEQRTVRVQRQAGDDTIVCFNSRAVVINGDTDLALFFIRSRKHMSVLFG